jgi:hypothetical protein
MEQRPDKARNATEGVPYMASAKGVPHSDQKPRGFVKGWSHFHWIMVALLVWGGYLAIGALQSSGNHASLRGLIVFGCVLGFLGLWLAALAVRQSRLAREDDGGEREA